jgi:hypothetical protein
VPVTARRFGHRLVLVAAVIAVGFSAFSAGVLAASLTIHSSLEMGRGSTESGTAITWWSQSGVSMDQIPFPAPSVVNATAATPTLLTGTNTSYALGVVRANDSAVRWDFQLKGPPILTEFELTFSVQNLTGSSLTTLTVYLETPLTAPSGTVLVSLFFDNGAGVTGFRAASQLSQQCSAFGACP